MSYANIYAPISGVIASVTTQQGETVSASSLNVPTFVTIVDLNRLEIYAYVDETDIGKIKPGLDATFTVDSFPEKDFKGKVTAVYPKATIQDNVVYYITLVSIENPEGKLKPDMTVNATIYLNKRDNVLAVPNRAIKREGGKKIVQVLEKGKPVQKAIKTGWKDGSYTEIIEGLKEGDKVVTGEAVKKEQEF
jgi:macrolide-specific efflux system membrane fusion protein